MSSSLTCCSTGRCYESFGWHSSNWGCVQPFQSAGVTITPFMEVCPLFTAHCPLLPTGQWTVELSGLWNQVSSGTKWTVGSGQWNQVGCGTKWVVELSGQWAVEPSRLWNQVSRGTKWTVGSRTKWAVEPSGQWAVEPSG